MKTWLSRWKSPAYHNSEINHTVPKVLDIVGLKGKEDAYPLELSGGERQRVAIARAIVRQPKILIADEPTGNLDPKHAWDVIKVLEKINRFGTTVLLTTHNQEIVNALKRRVVTIKDGHIVIRQGGRALQRLMKDHKYITVERIIKNGFINFGRNIWLAIAAIAMMAITLTILFFAIVSNSYL